MKTIYIDEGYICHAEIAEGRRAVETEAFDEIPESALVFFRFVPPGESYKGNVCPDGFIQCLDSAMVRAYTEAYSKAQAELADMRAALNVLGVSESEV